MSNKLNFEGPFYRSAIEVLPSLFEETSDYEFEVVDKFIEENLPAGFKKHGCKDIARNYEHMSTQKPGVTDGDIMEYQDGEIILSTMETILATLSHVLKCYFAGFNPLVRVKLSGQENLNLGYIEIADRTHVIYLELKSHEPGKKAILHLHESECPRQYKQNRHMLLKKDS